MQVRLRQMKHGTSCRLCSDAVTFASADLFCDFKVPQLQVLCQTSEMRAEVVLGSIPDLA